MTPLQRALLPLSWVYALVVRARNRLYDRAAARTPRARVPVVSVGNITVGGTGKTPMVIEIARRLRAMGARPGVLTRGYRTGREVEADEVRELRDALPGVPIVVDADRVAGATRACVDFDVDCLVMDDGFQHRRLARDLDIVLIDALNPWGGGHLLPAGRLREPLEGLRRAHLLMLTRANQVGRDELVARRTEIARYAPDKPIVRACVEAAGFTSRDGARRGTDALRGGRILAVSGLGNPVTFERLLVQVTGGAFPALRFPDHHPYGYRSLERILAAGRRAQAAWVVTTGKDYVKLGPMWPADAPELLRLDVRFSFPEDADILDALLRRTLETHL